MDDLTTFLRACLDDDERVARAALPGPWEAQWWGVQTAYEYDRPGYINHGQRVPIAHNSGTVGNRQAEIRNVEHIARWDPARVLADIDAKRRVIVAYMDAVHMHRAMSETDDDGKWDWLFKEESLEGVVKLLALPYADREGYREEWRP